MSHSIEAPMAYWSSNSLRPETCDLQTGAESPIHRYGLLGRSARIATGSRSALAATMDAAFGGEQR